MYIDVSLMVEDGMVHYPKDPEVIIKQFSSIKNGDAANNTHLSFGTHTGTHIDAPRHFYEDGIGIDKIKLETLTGECSVIEVPEKYEAITEDFLKMQNINNGGRILFKTKNSKIISRDKSFHEDYVYVASDAAKYMVEKGIILVGVDYLSVEGYGKGHETHRTLLGAGVVIIESLYLEQVEPGNYKLIAFPIKIKDSDGAPARVILEK
ncbi:MAG: cyclase family protein [Candidatus Acididesulfobacter diazotrophicus]|uniref:Kynurenine formamidase n=1 Tax=Candidatus Acididesulfobacter diazotrophicus TaxID=2597226 RepID=A0A519BMJ6_9DELT|nr:MAG: cyclase family protein [Candidatus Acididesulfobacter diazotrophicus]